MVSLLATIFVYGLAAAGLAALVRKAPWPKTWLHRKPLGCTVCMAGWSALALVVVGIVVYDGRLRWETVLTWFGALGVAVYVLTQSGVFVIDPLVEFTEREEKPDA